MTAQMRSNDCLMRNVVISSGRPCPWWRVHRYAGRAAVINHDTFIACSWWPPTVTCQRRLSAVGCAAKRIVTREGARWWVTRNAMTMWIFTSASTVYYQYCCYIISSSIHNKCHMFIYNINKILKSCLKNCFSFVTCWKHNLLRRHIWTTARARLDKDKDGVSCHELSRGPEQQRKVEHIAKPEAELRAVSRARIPKRRIFHTGLKEISLFRPVLLNEL